MTVKYINQHYCAHCDHPLTYTQKMHSDGRCPFCGVKDPSVCTVVKTVERSIKVEPSVPVEPRVANLTCGGVSGALFMLGFIWGACLYG